MQLVREVFPIRNISRVGVASASTFLKFAIDLVGHKEEKVNKEGLNTCYSLILTRFPEDVIHDFIKVFQTYDEKDPLWRRREHSLQCEMVLLSANYFKRDISLERITHSCFVEKTHKAKITKAHVLSVAVELASYEEVNALLEKSFHALSTLTKKKDTEQIFDHVNILVGVAYSEMTQIYGTRRG